MRLTTRRRTATAALTSAALVAMAGVGALLAAPAQAATGCKVEYRVTNQWPTGFGGDVVVTNLGDALSGWTLGWSFGAGQQITQAWGGTAAQSGATVTVGNASWNGSLSTGATAQVGFNATWSGSNPVPTSFTLNGVTCTGGTTNPTTPPPTSNPTTPPPTSNPTSPPAAGLVGWAAQNGGTSGGGSASTTTVTSSSALVSAASGTGSAVVRVSGTISCSGMLTIGSNKTIVGASGAKIVGCGLNIKNAKNVIVRNLSFDDWDDDAINIETSTNIWIDHNTFFTGYDGSVDTKRASDYVTISWNHFDGQNKNSLVGHSDDNGSQDRGKLRVTYHHNWFDGTNQRNPRVRFGNPVHVFNNLYSNVGSYGVASTMEAGVLVEGNYFENTDDPYHLGEGSSPDGSLVARNNHFVGSPQGQTGGSVGSIPYSYSLDTASSVKSIVSSGAGVG